MTVVDDGNCGGTIRYHVQRRRSGRTSGPEQHLQAGQRHVHGGGAVDEEPDGRGLPPGAERTGVRSVPHLQPPPDQESLVSEPALLYGPGRLCRGARQGHHRSSARREVRPAAGLVVRLPEAVRSGRLAAEAERGRHPGRPGRPVRHGGRGSACCRGCSSSWSPWVWGCSSASSRWPAC